MTLEIARELGRLITVNVVPYTGSGIRPGTIKIDRSYDMDIHSSYDNNLLQVKFVRHTGYVFHMYTNEPTPFMMGIFCSDKIDMSISEFDGWIFQHVKEKFVEVFCPEEKEIPISIVGMRYTKRLGRRGCNIDLVKSAFNDLTDGKLYYDSGNTYDEYAVSLGKGDDKLGWVAVENYGWSTKLLRNAISRGLVDAQITKYKLTSTGYTVNCTFKIKLVPNKEIIVKPLF